MDPAIPLSMALALVSGDGDGAPATAPAPVVAPPPAERGGPQGWIGAGGRNAFELGSPIAPDFGVEAIGGAWLVGEHVQPLARIGWSHGFGNGTTIDTLRFGAGAAGGTAIWRERLWLGGAVEPAAVRAWARSGGRTQTAWGATIGASALVELRLIDRLLVGVQLGPELCLPTLRFVGPSSAVQWGPLRFNAGLRLGVILGR